MKDEVETIRLLAWRTKGVKDVMYHYAEEGKLIELAALLMVAVDFLLPPFWSMYGIPNDEGENLPIFHGSMTLVECVASEIASLIDHEYRLMGTRFSKLAQICKEKKKLMMTVMLLLEIFERNGDVIYSHTSVAHSCRTGRDSLVGSITCIFKTSGLPVSGRDALFFMNNNDQWKGSGMDIRHGTQPMGLHYPFSSQPRKFTNLKMPANMWPGTSHGEQCSASARKSFFLSRIFKTGKRGSSSAGKSFYLFRSFKTSSGSEFCTTSEDQVKKTANAIEQHVSNSLPRQKWASLALAIKRGKRYV